MRRLPERQSSINTGDVLDGNPLFHLPDWWEEHAHKAARAIVKTFTPQDNFDAVDSSRLTNIIESESQFSIIDSLDYSDIGTNNNQVRVCACAGVASNLTLMASTHCKTSRQQDIRVAEMLLKIAGTVLA